MSLENLFEAARKKMGTKAERQAAHDKRSAEFDKRCAEDFEKMKVTDELLRKKCTL
jgi:hypothetical protein